GGGPIGVGAGILRRATGAPVVVMGGTTTSWCRWNTRWYSTAGTEHYRSWWRYRGSTGRVAGAAPARRSEQVRTSAQDQCVHLLELSPNSCQLLNGVILEQVVRLGKASGHLEQRMQCIEFALFVGIFIF